jgi:quinol-cytochrome oxidoreductase complex cytochrome b subunit
VKQPISAKSDRWRALTEWINTRFGLANTILRPVPSYSLKPDYWLGALAFIAFLICGLTGILQLQYYVPTPDAAYDSVQHLNDFVPYGNLIQSVHLYSAFAMIFFAFAHMMRGYFLSVHKRPRELMWIVGILMGASAMAMGFTGYLLPWTVLSKSATDISIGLVNQLPDPFRTFLMFGLRGSGTDSGLLLRFFALHTVILPALIFVLFALKLHMFEVHGVARPEGDRPPAQEHLIPWFPRVLAYMLLLSSIVGSAVLTIAVLFPVQLPAKFTYEAAASATPVPEWYFVWAYQILKFSVFEGQTGIRLALALLAAIMAAFTLLPLIDRSPTRAPRLRPAYVTTGAVAIVEICVLTIWGNMTPGMTIPAVQGVLVLGSSALITTCVLFVWHRHVTHPSELLYERFLTRRERQSVPRAISVPAARDALRRGT